MGYDDDNYTPTGSPFSTHRGVAQFHEEGWNEWARQELLTNEKLLAKEETALAQDERALKAFVKRPAPYPLLRLSNGRLTSLKKAPAQLQSVRKEISFVLEQKKFVQGKLQMLR